MPQISAGKQKDIRSKSAPIFQLEAASSKLLTLRLEMVFDAGSPARTKATLFSEGLLFADLRELIWFTTAEKIRRKTES